MTIKAMIVTVAAALSTGCTTQPPQPTASEVRRDTHERLNGLLWVQTSAEFQVLSKTAYSDASKRLRELIADIKKGRYPASAAIEQPGSNTAKLPPAVIVDVDETVLDNSPMSGRLISDRTGYDATTWSNWVDRVAADFMPGAREFLDLAESEGVTVFFVTNRTEDEEKETIEDLKPLVVSDETFLASGETGSGETTPWSSEKASRRAFIAKTHWVIAMIGDDLGDFIPAIRTMPAADRVVEANKHLDRFNRQWFLLPNPTYGSWEAVLYNRQDPEDKQLADKMSKVKAF
jgi:5'-nucleotidase (lipoprotein e(P4) family)